MFLQENKKHIWIIWTKIVFLLQVKYYLNRCMNRAHCKYTTNSDRALYDIKAYWVYHYFGFTIWYWIFHFLQDITGRVHYDIDQWYCCVHTISQCIRQFQFERPGEGGGGDIFFATLLMHFILFYPSTHLKYSCIALPANFDLLFDRTSGCRTFKLLVARHSFTLYSFTIYYTLVHLNPQGLRHNHWNTPRVFWYWVSVEIHGILTFKNDRNISGSNKISTVRIPWVFWGFIVTDK